MLKIFCGQQQGLNICHINSQSLYGKIDEFKYLFEGSDVDIICVSETWFFPELPNSFIAMQGYNIFRSDRVGNAGGVAIYIKSTLPSKVKILSPQESAIEYIFIETSCRNEKILIGSVYRKHKRVDVVPLMQVIADISMQYPNVVIAGDFNSNILVDDSLTSHMGGLGLLSYNTTTPTHFTTASTLLDLFFVNDKKNVLFYDQLSVPQFSKHDLIFMTLKCNQVKTAQTISFRDYKHVNLTQLEIDFHSIDWTLVYLMPSADDQVNFLNSNIEFLYEKHIPLKQKPVKHAPKPWFSRNIKTLMIQRDNAYNKWKRYRTTYHHEIYNNLRKAVTKSINNAKRQYYHSKFSQSVNSKATWKAIKEIGLNKKSSCSLPLDTDLNALNQKFISASENSNHPTNSVPDFCDSSSLGTINPNCDNFSFSCISVIDVYSSLTSIKSNAIGLDNIDPKFIKLIMIPLLPILTHIFNTILTKSTFPKAWKMAKIVPIPKSQNEFRPIAILCYFSKALEIIMYRQMDAFFAINSLITDCQSGFRRKRSCTTALINVSEDIRKSLDSGNGVFLLLLDHSKAFDSVDPFILPYKLKNWYGLSCSAAELVCSYLSDRFQKVSVGKNSSELLQVIKGVPQGSVLGPFLFSAYVNDVPKVVKNCKMHIYADDIQLYLPCNITNLAEGARKLNEDLQKVSAWVENNRLTINPRKSKCLFIYKKEVDLTMLPDILINNARIEYVTSAKNLGVIFNNKLSWNDHIRHVTGKISGMLRTLWSTQSFTPQCTRLLIAKSYLIPTLLYGCEIFANCDSVSENMLNVAYNNIARYVFGAGRYESISSRAYTINNVTFKNLLKIRTLLLLHKIIFLKEPSYLYERLRFSNSRRNNALIQLRHSCLLSERQFFIFGIRLWNSLPTNIQQLSNASQFKKEIFNYFK